MIDVTLLNLLPPLRRARGDRLYGPDEKHWVDLWKQEGAWLLGHRPEGAAREWKNQVDKGLACWAPSAWPGRLELLVRQLIPGTVAVRVYRNVDRAPASAVWRPWDDQPVVAEGGVLRLVLPTGPGQAVAVAFTDRWSGPVPDQEATSPAEAAGLVRAAAEVIRFTADARALQARQKAQKTFDLQLGSTGLFRRQGLWFSATVEAPHYADLFRAHLEAGFFLPPGATAWGLVPTDLSSGEWAAWKAVATQWSAEVR